MTKLSKILKWIFWIWVGLMLLLQTANLVMNGVDRSTLVIASELLIFLWFGIVYFFRRPLSVFVKTIIPNLYLRFIIVGYFSTVIAELVYMFSIPMHRELAWDLTLTAPWYLLWMIFWFRLIKKYDYSLTEAFVLAGVHGLIIEGLINAPILALIGLPLFIALYGCFFIVPYLLMKNDFNEQQHISLGKKIKLSFIPLIAFVIDAVWIFSLLKIFSLTLH